MKHLFVASVINVLLWSCGSDEETQVRGTVGYFEQKLYKTMDYTDLVQTFGEPADDKGSGIHIYVYRLEDGTEVWIGFTDQVIYAKHLDEQLNLLKDLL